VKESRWGILGGTFDPPHLGHLILAERARDQLSLERVLWVPAGVPWRKQDRTVSEAEHRVEMVRLSTAGNDAFQVWTGEVEREGPSYSVESLRTVRAEFGVDLVLIVGADALADLPNWREPERIVELARLAVAGREGVREAVVEAVEGKIRGLAAKIDRVEMPLVDISGTGIRAMVREGRSIRYLVVDGVQAYIARERLYTA